MTIHASKGLEFSVVHVPGMIATGLPGSNRPPRCVPPDSLIEGTEGLTGSEAVKISHDEEEECKFFVATSRAKNRLILYASSVMNNGNTRKPSAYINRIAAQIQRIVNPSLLAPQPITLNKISIDTNKTLTITDKQFSQYDSCPRRFLYNHVLMLGVKQTETAFMQMHNVVFDVLDWIKNNYIESTPSITELNTQFNQSWLGKGPVEHNYAEAYRKIGFRLIEFLMETRKGKQLTKPQRLKISFPHGDITILPDEVTVDQNGKYNVRQIKSGKQQSSEFDKIEYSILLEAAEQYYGHESQVEAIHLAGETQEKVLISDEKKLSRLNKCKNALAAIANGEFPPSPDSRSCPRCPNFFICGDVPEGKITIKNVI